MRCSMGELVVFDDNEGGQQGEGGGAVEEGVDVCAGCFLGFAVGWLQEEDGLRGEEEGGDVEEL